jgi:RimJ/RimL family protein N-acetyltransferase
MRVFCFEIEADRMTSVKWPQVEVAEDGREIRVRPIAYGDAPALHKGLHLVAQEGIHIGAEPEGVGDLPAMIERVRRYLTRPRATQLVAELEGKVVGAIAIDPGPFGRKDQHWCSLGLWLVPAARGIGVGTALVKAALKWAVAEGFEKAVAEVFATNEPSLALFRKFGFVTEGRQRNLFVLPGIGYVDNVLLALDLRDDNGEQER